MTPEEQFSALAEAQAYLSGAKRSIEMALAVYLRTGLDHTGLNDIIAAIDEEQAAVTDAKQNPPEEG